MSILSRIKYVKTTISDSLKGWQDLAGSAYIALRSLWISPLVVKRVCAGTYSILCERLGHFDSKTNTGLEQRQRVTRMRKEERKLGIYGA